MKITSELTHSGEYSIFNVYSEQYIRDKAELYDVDLQTLEREKVGFLTIRLTIKAKGTHQNICSFRNAISPDYGW